VTIFRTGLLGLVTAALVAPSQALDAQLIRVPSPDAAKRPITASVGVGYFQTQGRFDGQSGVSWALGEAFQYRGTVDVGLRSGALGITGTLASVPIRRSANPSGDGTIDFRQVMATFRSPEAQGFFQVIEVSTGLAQWANYAGTDVLSDDERKARNALAIVIGYGFGFGLGERGAFTVVQDYATIVGSTEGLPSGTRRSQQQYTTRLGFRYRVRGSR